ncbi:ABC transporter ATP-binding protein [Nonomuraea typhae]|uniref:ABC transporter ATP-binding protein n=1 Tax=Nonomuraea typhae TaxID=2603600 RepID=UPI0012FC74CC|nr:ABC transporter ATP-binding protein [Nonomuraea typhae]
MTLLETRKLSAGYGRGEVLRDADLTIGPGEVVVLLGANGAGKTTLMRALSGMIPSRGEILLYGRPVGGLRADTVARLGVAHVPQGRGTIVEMTVEENLRVGGYTRPQAEMRADLDRWLDFFPRLGERRNQPAGSMSGGEQQMLAVARALMSRPKLLLLDEPSLGLAPMAARDLFAKLAELNAADALAMLVVEQAAHLALGIAARAYTLTAGVLSEPVGVADLADREALRRLYLGAV